MPVHGRRRLVPWLTRCAAVLLAGGSLAVGSASPAAASDGAVVRTENGLVKGTVASSFRSFLGIPFAAPPVGDLRLRAPRPASLQA